MTPGTDPNSARGKISGKPTVLERFTLWMFRWRTPLILGFAVLTGVMAWFAVNLRVDASFNKTLPRDHEYIRTFTKYQRDFGGANRVLVALIARRRRVSRP